MRSSGSQLFPHGSLHIGEPVQIDWRTVCSEGVCGKARRLGLAEVVVGPRDHRGNLGCSIRVVGCLRIGAPLAVPVEEILLGPSLDPVASGVGAIAAKHQWNARLVATLVRDLRCFSDQLAVKNRRRLVGWPIGSRLGRTPKHIVGAEAPQPDESRLVRSIDSHGFREVDPDCLGRHRIVWIDAIRTQRPGGEHTVPRSARLDDRLVEQAPRLWRGEHAVDGDTTRREPKDGDVVWITSKSSDVPPHPLQGGNLVHVGIVALVLIRTFAAQRRKRDSSWRPGPHLAWRIEHRT